MLKLRSAVVLSFILFTLNICVPTVHAQDNDTSQYLQLIDKTKDLPPEQQVRALRQFLQDNPDTVYKEEVEENIANLQKFVNESDPQKKKEKKDAETYLKALKFSQKLTLEDQEAMWSQFLNDHPNSLYVSEGRTRLLELRRRLGLSPDGTKPKPAEKPITDAPIAVQLDYKSSQTAMLWAVFGGLVVPGAGHWYTGDYLIAGLLAALRVAGAVAFINGYVNEAPSFYILGGILGGASYLGDIADAPFSVDRYNEALEKKKGLAFNLSFKF